MKLRRLFIPALLVIAASAVRAETIEISDDKGGFVTLYQQKWEKLAAQKDNVRITGMCASACTLLTGYFPRKDICVTPNAALVTPGMQFVLATRHLERIADHATNIAEDIIFWVRGLDVRHGRGLTVRPESETTTVGVLSEVTENSHGLHPQVTPSCEAPGV